MSKIANKQVAAGRIMKTNRARDAFQSSMVVAVAVCATLAVGFAGIAV